MVFATPGAWNVYILHKLDRLEAQGLGDVDRRPGRDIPPLEFDAAFIERPEMADIFLIDEDKGRNLVFTGAKMHAADVDLGDGHAGIDQVHQHLGGVDQQQHPL